MKLTAQIRNDWPLDSPVARLCLRLWKALRHAPISDHYSFYDLKAMARKDTADTQLASAVLYLANPNVQVLKPSLLYEQSEGFFVELPESEVEHYVSGGEVRHPGLGTVLEAGEVLVAFTPGETLLRKKRRDGAAL